MRKVVILTGAGISAESGIQTFRGSGGLWEGYDINEVATFEGWKRNREKVLEFYNLRRKAVWEAKPNRGHLALVDLEKKYDVHIITQNIDNLHEKAGSTNILHLHGEILKAESTADKNLVYPMKDWKLNPGDTCEKGSQLRPHVVWFGEPVPMIEPAMALTAMADIFIVIGTSLEVYPAAGLLDYTRRDCRVFLVDPNTPAAKLPDGVTLIREKASTGTPKLVEILLNSPH